MKKAKLTIHYDIYDELEALPTLDKQLLEAAKNILKTAYAPYSKFNVGAALRLSNGKIITGNNQENASYPLGLCAERVAIFAAGSQYPNQPITALAISIKSELQVIDYPICPCGGCRQVISESEFRHQNDIRLIIQGETGLIYVFHSVKDILPFTPKGSDIDTAVTGNKA